MNRQLCTPFARGRRGMLTSVVENHLWPCEESGGSAREARAGQHATAAARECRLTLVDILVEVLDTSSVEGRRTTNANQAQEGDGSCERSVHARRDRAPRLATYRPWTSYPFSSRSSVR